MKKIHFNTIVEEVKKACVEINVIIDPKIKAAFQRAIETEESPLGREIIKDLILNQQIAAEEGIPLCQDTGMIVAFVEIGQGVVIEGGTIKEAINEGVRQGYKEGYLRNSVVECPIRRKNTGDNTPAIIHFDVVEGSTLKISLAAKGFGSENMSRIKMLKPAEGIEGIRKFLLETIKEAGGNCCPPIVVGMGIGGSFEKAPQLAKKSLLRELGEANKDPYIAKIEIELLAAVNSLGVGPQGLGGTTTALALHIETYPTHIAGLPVAININCHASRHKEIVF